ncbi:MAG: glycosyltransferase family 4 protein [Sulfitobacter sp.]|nr:glycosyltransferase family 4 protein [Sulfitobacter sp.]
MMELRPCFDGFAGIPQETRVLFSSFHELSNIDPIGLILHPSRRLARAAPRREGPSIQRLNRVGRMIISSEESEAATPVDRLRMQTERSREILSLLATTGSNARLKRSPIDTADFADYFWQRLFSKGLGPAEMDLVRQARYVAIRPSWLSLHSMGATRRYPLMDTSGVDVFVAHTPWPTRVSPSTQLVIRYHDAIPVFHPHQIKYPSMHHQHHYRALMSNAPTAVFACASEATRSDLLKLVPEAEDRSTVIPTSVSSVFHPEPEDPTIVADVIRSYLQGGKAPSQGSVGDGLPYLLMVSTIEPRKNHVRLLEAWEWVRRKLPDLKLVVVGSLGWNHGPILQKMKKWKQRGDLFHLSNVPTADLRLLYSNASAAVCPSVAEGFDMSGIEAMMCATPVIASDIPVHRENYGEAALYFNPYSTDDLAKTINYLISGGTWHDRRAGLTHAGLVRVKDFGRGELAQQWGEFFEDLEAGKYGQSPGRR